MFHMCFTLNLQDMVEWVNGRLMLTPELLTTFFEAPVGKIVRKTCEVLKDHHEISCVLMVGGFSNSKLLQRRVKAGVQRYGVTAFSPQRPHLAVVSASSVLSVKQYSSSTRTKMFRRLSGETTQINTFAKRLGLYMLSYGVHALTNGGISVLLQLRTRRNAGLLPFVVVQPSGNYE